MNIAKILIIDDNEAEHFVIKEVVEEFNEAIKIINAYDGKSGLAQYEEQNIKPDLIFLDINMPGMNGFEFLEEFERSKHNTAVIVMLTSSRLTQDKETCLAHKCVKDFISKSLTIEDLERISKI